jgi:hypothetical protein
VIYDHEFEPVHDDIGPINECQHCWHLQQEHAGWLARLWWRIGGWNFWGPRDS